MLCNFNSQEQKGYIALLYDHNFENDFDATIVDIKIKLNPLTSKYVYSNIDDKR